MKHNTRALVEAGVMVALGTALSLIKLFSAPQGGTVTAGSMIPVLLVALRWGPVTGVMTGIVYGVMQLIVDPFVVHPAQLVLDYIVAFGALGLAGFFSTRPTLGVTVGVFGRFWAHVASGIIFFAANTPPDTPVFWYSVLYNGSYLALEALISAVVISVLWSSRAFSWLHPESR